MRVTNMMIYYNSAQRVADRYENMYVVNQQIASGKRVNTASDDPLDAGNILGYREALNNIDQYKSNVDTGRSWLNYTESALSSAEQVLIEAKTLAEQLASGTYNDDQRSDLTLQAEQLYDQMIQLGNTSVNGRYVFAGFKTDTPPFSRDQYFNATYAGDDNVIQVSILQNAKAQINTTGQDVFLDDTNVFDVLRDLRDALEANDQEAIGDVLPRIDDAMRQVVTQRAGVGTSLRQMDAAESMLLDTGLDTEELLSVTEDADLVDAVTRLSTERLALEATLQSTSIISQLSLVNFL